MEAKQEPTSPTRQKLDLQEKNRQLSEVARVIKDHQGKITLTLYENVLQHLFEVVPELEAIQKNARLRSLQPGEKFVSEEDELKDFYVLTEGTLLYAAVNEKVNIAKEVKKFQKEKQKSAKKEAESQEQNPDSKKAEQPQAEVKKTHNKPKKLMTPGAIFGELTIIMQKKWRHANVYALEESSIIAFSNNQINRINKELSSKAEFQELLAFLTLIFPDFANASNSQQWKIIDCFKPLEFLPGQYIIKEGEVGNQAYLIKEGECIFQSTRNPLTEFNESRRGKKPMDVALRTKRGFLSSTTNTYQFGILEKNQWAGEERLLKEVDEPIGYSIVAKTKVRAFSISKIDANKKFTKEIMEFIGKLVDQRYLWIKERAKNLTQASVNVANMDPSDIKYDDNLAELKKRFPTATSYVLTNIRKKSIIAKSSSTTRVSVPSLPLNATSTQFKPMLTQTFHIASKIPAMATTSRVPGQDSSLPSIYASPRTFMQNSPDKSARLEAPSFAINHRHTTTMSMASSTSRLIRNASYAPVFSGETMKRHTFSVTPGSIARRAQSMDEEKLNARFKAEMNKKNLNKFMVGKRTIRLLDGVYGKRPATPNPFASLSGKVAVVNK